jgi:sphingolipid C9-methyltransferase
MILRFLGPRMIYTCGIVLDLEKEETLEQLQDNKLTVVCEKLGLKPGDRLLDIGCGWGTLVAFAAKNYGVDATGVTLARKQTAFGNARIKANGVDPSKARILCKDFRDVKDGPGSFNKIVSLEMAEVFIMSISFHDYPNATLACWDPPIWSILASGLRSPR